MGWNRFALGALIATLACTHAASAQQPLFETCFADTRMVPLVGSMLPGLHIRLLSGSVKRDPTSVTLAGTITLAVTFRCRGGKTTMSDVPPVYTLRDAKVTLKHDSNGGGAGVEPAFTNLHAKGQLELSLKGTASTTFFVRNFEIDAGVKPDGSMQVVQGEASLFGCTMPVKPGSQIDGSGLTLKGSALTCDGKEFANASLHIDAAGSLSGTAQHRVGTSTLDMSFTHSATALTGTGSWKGVPRAVLSSKPVAGLVTIVTASVVRANLERTMQGDKYVQSFALTFDADRIELRTEANTSGGEPWASAYLDPPASAVSGTSTTLALPTLPAAQDALRGARDACLNAANKLPDNKATLNVNEHDAAVNACWSANPAPPSVPSAPKTLQLELKVLAG
jgi:hypothetical protein